MKQINDILKQVKTLSESELKNISSQILQMLKSCNNSAPEAVVEKCRKCESNNIIRYGKDKNGKQNTVRIKTASRSINARAAALFLPKPLILSLLILIVLWKPGKSISNCFLIALLLLNVLPSVVFPFRLLLHGDIRSSVL